MLDISYKIRHLQHSVRNRTTVYQARNLEDSKIKFTVPQITTLRGTPQSQERGQKLLAHSVILAGPSKETAASQSSCNLQHFRGRYSVLCLPTSNREGITLWVSFSPVRISRNPRTTEERKMSWKVNLPIIPFLCVPTLLMKINQRIHSI